MLDSVRIARSIFPCAPRRICLEKWRTLDGIETPRQLDSIATLATSMGFDSFPSRLASDSTKCRSKASTSSPWELTLYWSNGVTKKIGDELACSASTPPTPNRLAELRRFRARVATSVGWSAE